MQTSSRFPSGHLLTPKHLQRVHTASQQPQPTNRPHGYPSGLQALLNPAVHIT
jgi:hypothetical protein